MKKTGALLCATMFALLCVAACGGGGGTGDDVTDNNGGNGDGTQPPIIDVTPSSPLDAYAKLPEIRFGSFYTLETGDSCKVKMKAPYTDSYNVKFSEKNISRVEIFDTEGNELISAAETFDISLTEGQIVYVNITPVEGTVKVDVTPKLNNAPQPFDIGPVHDASIIPTTSADPTADPLLPATINYVKRPDTLYVYCNAPEAVSAGPQVINHCTTRQDVSNQSVYFTMEQQSDNLPNGVYYGYRVRNTGTEDAYITVKNVGYQLNGAGSYFGEQEWVQFYNTKFALPDLDSLTASQRASWEALMNFGGNYIPSGFQPTTYRIPAGEYIYVFGGTTADAYGKFNVAGTANKRVTGNCQNAAVTFDVIGTAEGSYYVYDDYTKILPGTEGGDDHLGITDPETYGVVHCGEDVGYVVDNQASWIFNDETPSEIKLPVTFTNYYREYEVGEERKGEPGAVIPSTAHTQLLEEWVTHINVQNTNEGNGLNKAVGTDMTSFHTVFGTDQKPIIVGCEWYDSRGEHANIGNWMKDYQDVFTFTNQGDREREITVNINLNGGLATLVRNIDGSVVEGTPYYACERGNEGFGDAFEKAFHYTVKIPAHTTVQFVVEYNLMANSTGYVRHSVDLV